MQKHREAYDGTASSSVWLSTVMKKWLRGEAEKVSTDQSVKQNKEPGMSRINLGCMHEGNS